MRTGKDIQEVAHANLTRRLPTTALSGEEALAYWRRVGALGVLSDLPDSPEYARQLRREAEARGPLL